MPSISIKRILSRTEQYRMLKLYVCCQEVISCFLQSELTWEHGIWRGHLGTQLGYQNYWPQASMCQNTVIPHL